MLDAPPQPKISFLRTRRFWLRWAVPGLLLALWVEGMLFEQNVGLIVYTTSSLVVYSLEISDGSVSFLVNGEMASPSEIVSLKWDNLDAAFRWNPGFEPFPKAYRCEGAEGSDAGFSRCITIPLWLPLILWLLIAHLWFRHLRRKQAALP